MYADYMFYLSNGGTLEEGDISPFLKQASNNIDILTFRRIHAIGFENLKDWQKSIIQESVCAYATWLCDNSSLIETYLKSYSINGTSMSMDGAWNVYMSMGVAIPYHIFSLIESTGLCNHSLNCRF